MSTLGLMRLRDDQTRGPEQVFATDEYPGPWPQHFRAYPTDYPYTLTLGRAPALAEAKLPVSIYRGTSFDQHAEQPTIVERYYAGYNGHLYPTRLKTITAQSPAQTFANLPGLQSFFSDLIHRPLQVVDPIYALQSEAFRTPLIPPITAFFCPDGLSADPAYKRIEQVLRFKLQNDVRFSSGVALPGALLGDIMKSIYPRISRNSGLRWGDCQMKSSLNDAIQLMTHGDAKPFHEIRRRQPDFGAAPLAMSPMSMAPLAQAIDNFALSAFSFTAFYEEGHPLYQVWNHVEDQYESFLTPDPNDANYRRLQADHQASQIAFQTTLSIADLLNSQSRRLTSLPPACRNWIDRSDFLRGPYTVTVSKTRFDEVQLIYSPTVPPDSSIHSAAFAIYLDLPFMALSCSSLVVEESSNIYY